MSSSADHSTAAQSRHVYAISSGAYSDYTVHCIFERVEDALAYLAAVGKVMESQADEHELWIEKNAEYDGWRVEKFQFWPTGQVPHANGWPKGGLPHGEHPYDYGYGEGNAASMSAAQKLAAAIGQVREIGRFRDGGDREPIVVYTSYGDTGLRYIIDQENEESLVLTSNELRWLVNVMFGGADAHIPTWRFWLANLRWRLRRGR